jgi:GT2 family glycosyltransferase
MDVSVIIPTFSRPERVGACVASLARQTLPRERFEVLIGIDGPDQGEAAAVAAAGRGLNVTVRGFPKRWQAAVRNDLAAMARGRVFVFFNDDVVPEPGCLEAHLRAHTARGAPPSLVIGDSPWRRPEPDTLFDRLIRTTSMVFFYDQMPGSSAWREAHAADGRADEPHDPDRDWGFRHAWLLNLSCPAALYRDAGGLTVFEGTYGFEDDEFAWRAATRHGARVLFEPGAVAVHDHRLTPHEYLARERKLGRSARAFARAAPECARAMFGRDIASDDELRYSRDFVEREAAAAERLRATFERLATIPASAIAGPHASELAALLYQQHLLLKRWTWRAGLVEESSKAAKQQSSK